MEENHHKKFPRVYISQNLKRGVPVLLSSDQSHYLLTVLRKKTGDTVLLFNGREGEWLAELSQENKKQLVAMCKEQLRPQNSLPSLWLVFSPLKKHRQDFLIEKATELGATHLMPVEMRYTNLFSFNQEKVGKQCIEATEQCERLSVPTISALKPLVHVLKEWPSERPLYVALERASEFCSLSETLDQEKDGGILVGPEGGFSEQEVELLRQQPFVRFFSLGELILRAETAAIISIGLYGQLKRT